MASRLLLEDGVSFLLLEDGTSKLWINPVNATQVYLRNTLTLSTGTDAIPQDMLRQSGAAGHYYYVNLTAAGSNIPIEDDAFDTGFGWYSERVAVMTTVTALTFHHYASIDVQTAGTLRVRVWKQGADPAHQQTLVVDYLGGTLPNAIAAQDWDLPLLVSPLVVAPGERFVIRLTGEPLSGSTMEVGQIILALHGPSTDIYPADVHLAVEPAVSMQSNIRRFYVQRTAVNGIGTFYDMTETPVTQAPMTGVVNTFAGSSGEAQWTRTAGGTVLEWVSPRFADSWYFDNVTVTRAGTPVVIPRAQGLIYAIESNALANVTIRVRLYRRRGTVEVECTVYQSSSLEMPTTYSPYGSSILTNFDSAPPNPGYGAIAPIDFQPDDRLVLRAYITPISTMASGYTATLQYDGTSFQSYVDIFETGIGAMKAESDPAAPARISGGDTMGGVGN